MYLGVICYFYNIWIKDGENEGMKIFFIFVYNDKFSYLGSK